MQKILDYYIEYEIMNRFNAIKIKSKNGIDLAETDFKNTDLVKRKINEKKLEVISSLLESKIKDTSFQKDSIEAVRLLINEDLEADALKIALKEKVQSNWLDYEKGYEDVIDQLVRKITDNKLLVLYPIINKKEWRFPLTVFECTLKDSKYEVGQYYLHQESLASIIANILSVSVSEVYDSIGGEFMSFYRSLSTLKNDNNFELINIIDQEIFSKYESDEFNSIWDMKDFGGAALSNSFVITLETMNEAYIPPFREELELLRDHISKKEPPELLKKYLLKNDFGKPCDTLKDAFHFGSYSGAFSINEKQAKVVSAYQNNALISVSGPPGTGKTTVLKELIADNFVRKVKRVIDCWDEAWQSFEGTETDGKPLYKTPFGGSCQNSMIVTSTNNKAVENIGIELLSEIEYFKGVGNANYIPVEQNKDLEGLFCAKLGNNNNMTSFKMSALLKLADHIQEVKYNELVAAEYKEDFSNTWQTLEMAQKDIVSYLSKRTEILEKMVALGILNASMKDSDLTTNHEQLKQAELGLKNELENSRMTLMAVEKDVSDLKKSIVEMTGCIDLASLEKNKIVERTKQIEDTEKIPLIGKLLVKLKKLEKDYGTVNSMQIRVAVLDSNMANYAQICEDDQSRLASKTHNELELKGAYKQIQDQLEVVKEKLAGYELLLSLKDSFEINKSQYALACNWLDSDYLLINDLSFTQKRNTLFTIGLKINEQYILKNSKEIAGNLEKIFGDTNWFKSLYHSKFKYNEKQIPRIKMLWETLFLCFPVVTTTLHSFEKSKFHMLEGIFDTVLLDEAGQVLPHMVAAPLYRARRAVIVGDVFQLEPIRGNLDGLIDQFNFDESVKDHINIEYSSAQHYADRGSDVYEKIGESQVGIILEEHRRCEAAIVAFSNEVVYKGKLKVVKPNEPKEVLKSNLCFIDVRGHKNRHNENPSEVEICKKLVDLYVQVYGLEVKSRIGIITPFKNQSNLLKKSIDGVAIGTVHTFQGQEKDFIILSSVIDNTQKNSGIKFVGDKPNFLNVAFTRGKKQLVVIGSYEAYLDNGNYLKASMGVIEKYGYVYSMYNPELSERIEQDYMLQFMGIMGIKESTSQRYAKFIDAYATNGLIVDPKKHYALLKNAIVQSDHSVCIVSPWFTDKVLNREMLDTFKSRCASVQYEICFGNHASKFTLEEIDRIVEIDNKRDNNYVTKETLKNHLKELRAILGSGLVYKPPLHTKALIIDDEFMIIGSHNWLSNTGQGTGSKDEISCIVTDKDMIDYVKERYFSINNLKES